MKENEILAGKYRLEELLGEGSWGQTYRATHLLMNRQVAVKILFISHTDNKNAVERFENEARIVAQLNHSNIVSAFDFGVSDTDQPFFVMELVNGHSLMEIVDSGAIPEQRALPIFMQLCDALAAAHARGVFHRDIKPANVVITSDKDGNDRALLVDFGLAKATENDEKHLTSTGVTVGTPGYLSPEQYFGQAVTPAADIYSLGCLMYECLTGKLPFYGNAVVEILKRSLEDMPEPFRVACPDVKISRSMEWVVFKALEKSAADRYRSALRLKADLKRVQSGESNRFPLRCAKVCDKLLRIIRRHAGIVAGCLVSFLAIVCVANFVPMHQEIVYHPAFTVLKYPEEMKRPPDFGLLYLRARALYATIPEAARLALSNLNLAKPKDASDLAECAFYMSTIHRGADAELFARKARELSRMPGTNQREDGLMFDFDIARALAEQDKFQDAHDIAQFAEQQVELKYGKNRSEYYVAETTEALTYELEGKYLEARDCYAEAMKVQHLSPEDIRNLVLRDATVLSKAGRYQDAIPRFNEALSDMRRAAKLDNIQWVLLETAAAEQRARHIDRALDLCREVIDMQPAEAVPDPMFADCLSRCATMLRSKHCYANADELDKQASELNKLMGRNQPPLD